MIEFILLLLFLIVITVIHRILAVRSSLDSTADDEILSILNDSLDDK